MEADEFDDVLFFSWPLFSNLIQTIIFHIFHVFWGILQMRILTSVINAVLIIVYVVTIRN